MKSIKEFENEFTWYTNLNHGYFSLSNLYIGHYGYEKLDETKGIVTNNNPAFRLHFITEGHLLFGINNKTYKLKKNCCFLVRPDINTNYQGICPPPRHIFGFRSAVRTLKDWFLQWVFRNPIRSFIYRINTKTRCVPHFTKI